MNLDSLIAAKQEQTPPQEESVLASAVVQTPDLKEKTYQVYKSSLDNQRMAMKSGKVICITAGKYVTDKEDEIEFLDYEIAQGLPYLKKEGVVTSSDLDPMSSLRKKIIEDYIADQEELAKLTATASRTPAPKLGTTSKANVVPASTADLSVLAAGSSSVAE